MDKKEILDLLKQRYIKQGYIKQGSIIIDFFPKEEIEELVSQGKVEIRNSTIPTVALSKDQRNQLHEDQKIKWSNRF